MKNIQKISYFLYYSIAKNLPRSHAKYNLGSKYIRQRLIKNLIEFQGENVNIEKGAIINRKVSIDDNSSIGVNAVIGGKVIIGKNVMMGPEVSIFTKNHSSERTDIPMIQQGYTEENPVIIKDDVWIGSRVTILPGVTIGEGVIIGAGSIVTKNIESYTIVGGNPARVIRKRKLI